jgi:hypothetical protein
MVGLLILVILATERLELVTVHNGSIVKVECLSAQDIEYLHQQSLHYKVTPTRLLAALIKVACEDKLLNATFDDTKIDSIIPRQRQRRYRQPKLSTTIVSDFA